MTCMSRKAATITSIACGCVIVSLGITCLVLGLKGYFTFEDPCIGVESFVIKDLQIDSSEGGDSGSLMGIIDAFTGGLASQLVPTQATMTIEMILEVNNTNPYNLDYEQKDEGLIEIPADSNQTQDLVIGTWEVPSSTLKKRARNNITVTMTTTIDLLSTDTMVLASGFMAGQAMAFRVKGGIEGSSWLPGFTGHSSFVCLASLENILDFETGAEIKCKHSTKVGNIIDMQGEIGGLEDIFDEQVDPACWV